MSAARGLNENGKKRKGIAIWLKRHKKLCVFCGNDDALTEFEGKSICTGCLKKIKDI